MGCRDPVFSLRNPVARQGETHSLCSAVYVALDALGAATWIAAGIAFTAGTGLRLAAIYWNLSLPTYRA